MDTFTITIPSIYYCEFKFVNQHEDQIIEIWGPPGWKLAEELTTFADRFNKNQLNKEQIITLVEKIKIGWPDSPLLNFLKEPIF